MLAHRLLRHSSVSGLFEALPTMATSNAMLDRLARAYRYLFAKQSRPSIALVHGARSMHKGFRIAVLRGGRPEQPYSDDADGDATASAACAMWIADDRRRAFVADAGAGTVDQALQSVLSTVSRCQRADAPASRSRASRCGAHGGQQLPRHTQRRLPASGRAGGRMQPRGVGCRLPSVRPPRLPSPARGSPRTSRRARRRSAFRGRAAGE